MPNRSMVRRALKLSRAGHRRRGDTDGPVTFVAMFPDGAFGADVPGGFDPAAVALEAAAIMPVGLRPVAPRVWWKPDDPTDPGGTGVAVVRLDDYGYDVDAVYVHRVEPGDSVDVYTVWDKPHRVRWAKDRPGMVVSTDPAVIRATRLMFDQIADTHGFLPSMEGWLSGLYEGRWFIALEWDPYYGFGVLLDTVTLMDGFRRDCGARVRLYGTHVWHRRWEDGRAITLRQSGAPEGVRGGDAEFFLKAMRAFRACPRGAEARGMLGSVG